MNEEQMLFHAMVHMPAPDNDDIMLKAIRRRFYNADKPHTEFDIECAYRLERAQTLLALWKHIYFRT